MTDFSYHIFDDGHGYCDVDMSGSLGILHFTHEVGISFFLDRNCKVTIQRVTELSSGGFFVWDLSCLDEREQSLLREFKEYVENVETRKESCA